MYMPTSDYEDGEVEAVYEQNRRDDQGGKRRRLCNCDGRPECVKEERVQWLESTVWETGTTEAKCWCNLVIIFFP